MKNQSVLNEEVFLPSRGIIYPKEYNVPQSLIVSPFKTKDLKGLFGSNSASAINTLIKNCIVGDFAMDCRDLHVEDRTALFTRIRAITLGSNYSTTRECSNCKKQFDVEWDLNDIECSYLDVDEYPIPITLPECNKRIHVGVVIPSELREAQDLIERRKNRSTQQNENKEDDVDDESELLFYYFASMIKRIDGVIPSLQSKIEFILDCSPEDYGYLQFIDKNLTFGINNKKIVKCPRCKTEHTIVFSPTEQFFRSTHGLPSGIRISKGILGRDPTKTV